jgi:glycosyltransferase involved in cell wall biosynthesis
MACGAGERLNPSERHTLSTSVSIIIPAYNAAPWLAETIDSALAQTLPACSIVVVDDGSTDETASIPPRYADAVIFLRQKNAGVCAARNRGASATDADWLLFLDADDRLRPDAVASLCHRASLGDFGVVYGQSVDLIRSHFGEERGDCAMEGLAPAAARAAFWKAPIATPGAAMIRRRIFDSVGGWNERFNTTADRDLWCRTGAVSEFGFIHQVIVERRIHEENMSADKNRARRQAVEVQLHFLAWCAERNINAAFLETSVAEIFERNTQRAIEERAFVAATWIADEAKARGIHGAIFDRARRLAAMPQFASELELKVRGFLGL